MWSIWSLKRITHAPMIVLLSRRSCGCTAVAKRQWTWSWVIWVQKILKRKSDEFQPGKEHQHDSIFWCGEITEQSSENSQAEEWISTGQRASTWSNLLTWRNYWTKPDSPRWVRIFFCIYYHSIWLFCDSDFVFTAHLNVLWSVVQARPKKPIPHGFYQITKVFS